MRLAWAPIEDGWEATAGTWRAEVEYDDESSVAQSGAVYRWTVWLGRRPSRRGWEPTADEAMEAAEEALAAIAGPAVEALAAAEGEADAPPD